MSGRSYVWETLLLAALMLAAVSGSAQLDTGTISGSVTDPSGAAIAGAAIMIRNVATGVTRTLETNAVGRYEATALPVGNYEVRASLSGFQTLVRSGITLTVGLNAVVDMTLRVGDVTQSITITGEASQVETTTATVSNLVSDKQVSEIPLNNRDLTQLVYLEPGVLRVPQIDPASRTTVGGRGDKMTVAGARGSQNVYLVDGASNSDLSGNPQGETGAYAGAETVKEFQIITNNYSAEYPSRSGAIISAVTKSGTNEFHGSLFEFLRNSDLDAAKWEDNAFLNGVKPSFKRNQFGGSFGGPIVKDHTFFFTSYEGLRERQGSTATSTVFTSQGRLGNLGASLGGPVTVSPVVKPYLNLWPLPGQNGTTLLTDYGDGRALVGGTQLVPVNDDYGSVKIDHQFTSQRKGFLAFTFNIDDSSRSTIMMLPAEPSTLDTMRKYVFSGHHTSILSPAALNEVTIAYTSVNPPSVIPIDTIDWSNFNGIDLRFRPEPQIKNMGSLSPGTAISPVGYADDATSYPQKVLNVQDSASLTRQRHTIKFGMQFLHFGHPIVTSTGATNGNYTFSNVGLFLQGKPTGLEIAMPAGAIVLGQTDRNIKNLDLRQSLFGFYFQDNYAVLPSLTLNLGLRYEFLTVPSEANGNTSGLRSYNDTQMTVGPLFMNPTLRNFSPRFGFAYSPGDHKTSLRGGFGIYYDPPTVFQWRFNAGAMLPFLADGMATDPNSTGSLAFPNAYATQQQLLQATPAIRAAEYNQKPSYISRWSLTLEHQIGGWLFSAGYTGSRAYHLWVVSEAAMNKWVGWPANVPTGQKQFEASLGLINPTFNRMTIMAPFGNDWYNGLSVNVLRRLTAGLQFQVAYSLSHNIDQSSSNTNMDEGLAQGQRSSYYWGDLKQEKGPSLFDIRNNVVTNLTYRLPALGFKGVGGALVNGWQVAGVLTVSDGHPFDIQDSNTAQTNAFFSASGLHPNLIPGGKNNAVLGNPNLYYDPTQFVPSTCIGATVCKVGDPTYRVGFYGDLGKNSVVGPGLATFDFSTSKNVTLTEARHLQFRAEFFNLLNRPNYFIPNATPFLSNGTRNPAAGKITSTITSARQIQFGLKFLF